MEKSYAILSKSESLTKAIKQELDALGFSEEKRGFSGNNLYVHNDKYISYEIDPIAGQVFDIPKNWDLVLQTMKQHINEFKAPAKVPIPQPTPAYVMCTKDCSAYYSGSSTIKEISVGEVYQVLVSKSKAKFPDGEGYVLKCNGKEIITNISNFEKSTKALFEECTVKNMIQVGYYYDGTRIFYVSKSDLEDIVYNDFFEGYVKHYDVDSGLLSEVGKSFFIGKNTEEAKENLPVVTFGTINYHYDLERKEFYKAGRTIRFSEIINFFERLYSLEIESYQIIIDEDSTIHFGCHDGTFGELEKVYESIKLL